MNRTILGLAIRNIFMDAADAKGGGGGGTPPAVKPEEARAFVSEFVHDPETIKTLDETKIVEYHGKLKGKLDGLIKAEVEKAKKAPDEDVVARKEKWTKGELKLEAPKDSKLSQADVDEIVAIARERGLSQEQASELVANKHAAVARFEASVVEGLKAERARWVEQIKADPEMGGDKLKETQRITMLPIERFATPELRAALRETGFGDHPLFVKFLLQIGRAMSEDDPDANKGGGGGGDGKKDAATVLYGETKTT